MFLVTYFVLWILFVVHSVVILLVLRQVGVLHLRIAPVGARAMSFGPKIGQLAPSVTIKDVEGVNQDLHISRAMETDVLLVFASPGCAACISLVRAIRPLARETDGDLRWALVTSGGREASRRFRKKHRLRDLLLTYSPKVQRQFNVGPTPYGVLISKQGVVLSKGIVNQMEHLESLLQVRDRPNQTRHE